MEKITSFTIDHIRLQPGLYVSRKDKVGESTVTTFDLRLTSPNEEPVMNTAEMHAMSIWLPLICAMNRTGKRRFCTLDRWDVVLVSTCCWPVIMKARM